MAFNHFSDLSPQDITYEPIAAQYQTIFDDLEGADEAGSLGAIARWDALRRELMTWSSLIKLQYRQDTSVEARKAANDVCDELTPRFVDLDVKMKRLMLSSPHREALEAHFGAHLFNLWDCDVAAFAPEIQDDMVAESRLKAAYMELRAGAKVSYKGEEHTLAGIAKYSLNADRAVRHGAEKAKWAWYAEHGDKLDEIFDGLVRVRHKMARSLGYDDYVGLGYRLMQRVDYEREDVARFRSQVRDHLVPLVVELHKEKAEGLGVETLHLWDERMPGFVDPPSPMGDTPWLIEQAHGLFEALGEEPRAFYEALTSKGLLDLDTRDAKASGAFCTAFPDHGTPFIFANFNGTMDDIRVFIHELGHAFQFWTSRTQDPSEYLWPTYEACEIHSMGLEFLALPFMERFFGEAADDFRRLHLVKALLFIPYGVAVDHFQHLIYENPEATPAERHGMWQQMERTYLPWRQYGDLERPASGGLWQQQLHIYGAPFYYIDYTLAQTCALQLYLRSQEDFAGTMDTYVTLCHRGGEAPFQDLARSAGLTSPLDEGCLEEVVNTLRPQL